MEEEGWVEVMVVVVTAAATAEAEVRAVVVAVGVGWEEGDGDRVACVGGEGGGGAGCEGDAGGAGDVCEGRVSGPDDPFCGPTILLSCHHSLPARHSDRSFSGKSQRPHDRHRGQSQQLAHTT